MDYLNDAANQLLALGPEALLGLVCIAICYGLKVWRWFPKRLLPLACLCLGAVFYPLITSPGQAPPDIRYPIIREVMLGGLIGFIAWIVHNKLLKKIEERIPWLKGWLNNDTEQIEKKYEDKKPAVTGPPAAD